VVNVNELVVLVGCIAAAFVFAWQRPRAAKLASMAVASCGAASLGLVLSLIRVMENLDKPDQVIPGITAAMSATLYGTIAASLFGTLAKAGGDDTIKPDELAVMIALPFALTMLAVFVVLHALSIAGS